MEEYQKYFSRPLFITIFRPDMLKFHPYYLLLGNTRVEFVIYRMLKILGPGLEGMAMNELSACVLGSAYILTYYIELSMY